MTDTSDRVYGSGYGYGYGNGYGYGYGTPSGGSPDRRRQ